MAELEGKSYTVKTYNVDGSYKETINPDKILNEISFSAALNGGLGQLQLQTEYKFEDTSYKGGEYVKVWLYDGFHKEGKQIYYGFISEIQRKVDQSREYTTFTCLGVGSLLKSIIYTSGSYSQSCYNMMVNIRNFFNNYYPGVISLGEIANTITTTQNWNWSYNDCGDCFNTIANAIGYHWLVDGDGALDLFTPSTRDTHILHMGQEINSITVTNSIEQMVNYLYLQRNGAMGSYQDASSQGTYGMKMKYVSNTALNSTATQNQYGNSYINEYKNPKQSVTILVNELYPFEDIQPGDKVTVLNTDLTTLSNMIVSKVAYKPDQATLTIDYEDTLWKVIN